MENQINVDEIIAQYTKGEITLEQANKALDGTGMFLNPEKNAITLEEVGKFGLLDTGTGSLDKVEVHDMELVHEDCGDMYALCIFNGKTYHVHGKKLEE